MKWEYKSQQNILARKRVISITASSLAARRAIALTPAAILQKRAAVETTQFIFSRKNTALHFPQEAAFVKDATP